jgi:hypothetical protein
MSAPDSALGHAALIAEFIVRFVALPLCLRLRWIPLPLIPALWLLAAYCLFRLRTDPDFNQKALWNAAAPRSRCHRF